MARKPDPYGRDATLPHLSLFAMVVWLIASAAFSLHVSNFANYDRLYGSIGAVIILLFWLYISSYIVPLGAEINAEVELQTAKDTTAGKSRPRGAFVANTWPVDLTVKSDR